MSAPRTPALLAAALLTAAAVVEVTEVEVTDAEELARALADAAPGDTIRLADGTYQGNFEATTSGTRAAPVTLTGSAAAVLTARGGYAPHLDGAAHWNRSGFTVTGGRGPTNPRVPVG